MVITLKPIWRSASLSRSMRPSNTNAGLLIVSYTARQSTSRNSFHSVAMTTASLCCAAARAVLAIVTCFLTEKRETTGQAKGVGIVARAEEIGTLYDGKIGQ